MSLASEIRSVKERLQTILANSNAAITGKGGTAAADMSGVPEAIVSIVSGQKSIAVTSQPYKTNYVPGETFVTYGLGISKTNADGTTEDVTDYVFEPSTPLAVGNKNIYVSKDGEIVSVPITVEDDTTGKLWNIQNYGDSDGDGSSDSVIGRKRRFANGVFVTVRYSNKGDSKDGFWSADGINWNKVSMPMASYWYGVCYGGGRWIAWTQGNGSSRPCYTAYSDDNGKSWTSGGTLPTDGDGNYITMGEDTVVYADGKFLCRTGKGVVYSGDGGETWQFIAHETALHDMEHIIFNGERYVGINAYSGYATYSDDGSAWADVELPVKGVSDGGFAFGAGKFVFTPLASTTCLYSENGVTWETSTIADSASGIPITGQWDVAYGDGLFIAATYLSKYSGFPSIKTLYSFLVTCRSTDGITWDEPFLSNPMALDPDVVFANGKFYAFGISNVAVCPVLQ